MHGRDERLLKAIAAGFAKSARLYRARDRFAADRRCCSRRPRCGRADGAAEERLRAQLGEAVVRFEAALPDEAELLADAYLEVE